MTYLGANTATRRFWSADERGSIVAASIASGAVTGVFAYDEYGVPTANAPRFGYTGQRWLAELGLSYYKARMYSTRLGRFLQTDPIGYGDGMNWYNYVGGDPVNSTDPSGRCETTIDGVTYTWHYANSSSCTDNGSLGRAISAYNGTSGTDVLVIGSRGSGFSGGGFLGFGSVSNGVGVGQSVGGVGSGPGLQNNLEAARQNWINKCKEAPKSAGCGDAQKAYFDEKKLYDKTHPLPPQIGPYKNHDVLKEALQHLEYSLDAFGCIFGLATAETGFSIGIAAYGCHGLAK